MKTYLLAMMALAVAVGGGVTFAVRHPSDARASGGSDESLRIPAEAAGPRTGQQQLMDRWAPYAEQVYGVPAGRWRAAMGPTIRKTTDAQIMRALREPDFERMMRVLDGALPTAAVSGSVAAASGADAALEGFSYNVVTPCRVLDTRNVGRRVPARGTIDVQVAGSDFVAQGGAAHECGVPTTARAVVLNLTAVAPAGPGFLSAYPQGSVQPSSSSLNYIPGDIRANEVLVRLGDGAIPGLTLYSHDEVDVVADVVGFFAKHPDEVLGCTRVTEYFMLPPGNYGSGFAECPQGPYGERLTHRMGGACAWVVESPGQPEPGLLSGTISAWNWMQCEGENQSAVTRTFMVTALCCSVK